jgi:hypothetical protein
MISQHKIIRKPLFTITNFTIPLLNHFTSPPGRYTKKSRIDRFALSTNELLNLNHQKIQTIHTTSDISSFSVFNVVCGNCFLYRIFCILSIVSVSLAAFNYSILFLASTTNITLRF